MLSFFALLQSVDFLVFLRIILSLSQQLFLLPSIPLFSLPLNANFTIQPSVLDITTALLLVLTIQKLQKASLKVHFLTESSCPFLFS